jgi:two-component system, NarL family, response regulator LiaR
MARLQIESKSEGVSMLENDRPIRVMIVDDHDMLREGLNAFFKSFDDLEVVGEAASGEEAVRLCLQLEPDVVLMDLAMPEMDGCTAIRLIHEQQPAVHIIVLSSFSETRLVKTALQNGATSYLLKNISASRLADAIRTTMTGLRTLAPEATQALLDSAEPAQPSQTPGVLTERELEVMNLMAKGLPNTQIAEKLNISVFTVKNHVSSILSKLGVSSRTEAVAWKLQRQ